MAMNMLLHGGKTSNGFGGGQGSNSLQSIGGKLVGQLASNLFSSNSNRPPQQQNYYGGPPPPQQQQYSGLGGAVMSGVSHIVGGQSSGVTVRFALQFERSWQTTG
jgi:hypothetical protein